jgi:RNA-directed DNA polymerase
MKFLRHRIADERVLRLIGEWLAAGVIEDGTWAETGRGSPQGASASPLPGRVPALRPGPAGRLVEEAPRMVM